jgi:hypothetical protein
MAHRPYGREFNADSLFRHYHKQLNAVIGQEKFFSSQIYQHYPIDIEANE